MKFRATLRLTGSAAALALVAAACGGGSSHTSSASTSSSNLGGSSTYGPPTTTRAAEGLSKIKHVVVIMQENRSFDSYFGTFPGANGIPANVCVPAPSGPCQAPFHDPADVNGGGPHGDTAAVADIAGG